MGFFDFFKSKKKKTEADRRISAMAIQRARFERATLGVNERTVERDYPAFLAPNPGLESFSSFDSTPHHSHHHFDPGPSHDCGSSFDHGSSFDSGCSDMGSHH